MAGSELGSIEFSSSTYTSAQVDALLNGKQNVLVFDSLPTAGSTNPVTSNGVLTKITEIVDAACTALDEIIYDISGGLPPSEDDDNLRGMYVMNPDTLLWHEVTVRTTPEGVATLAVDQTGIDK